MKIAIATGTRADWGLLQPLAEELRKRGAQVNILVTHQHLMARMGNTIDEIRNDGFEPATTFPAAGDPATVMAQATQGAADALHDLNPDAIIILGDRCEMLGVAAAALFQGVPIVHIAGGTVSEGAFDDSIRNSITKMATLHFPETAECGKRIRQMGENPDDIHVTGALGVENSMKIKRMTLKELTDSLEGWNPGNDFLVVTLHSATLESDNPLQVQENLLRALEMMDDNYRFIFTYPNSDTDPTSLIESLRNFEQKHPRRVKVVASLGKRRYLSAAALSRGIVGNSSSALVETPSLGVGSLDIGNRQKGREHGDAVIHCGTTIEEIHSGLQRLISPAHRELAKKAPNPYYGKDTSGRMADIILSYPFHPYPQKHFHAIKPSQDAPV